MVSTGGILLEDAGRLVDASAIAVHVTRRGQHALLLRRLRDGLSLGDIEVDGLLHLEGDAALDGEELQPMASGRNGDEEGIQLDRVHHLLGRREGLASELLGPLFGQARLDVAQRHNLGFVLQLR